jgi:hypothetical protein
VFEGGDALGSGEPDVLEKEVAGEYNTFRVYVFLLRHEEASSRDVQRALAFSSPWLATHHLIKLEQLGLVQKDPHGTYHVVRRQFSILRFFFLTGHWIVPHTLFLACLFGAMAVGFLLYLGQHPYFTVALALAVIGLVASIVETIRFYRLLPPTGR